MEDGNILESSAPDSGAENTGGSNTADPVVDSGSADTVISSEVAPPDAVEGGESVPESSEASSDAPETEVISGTVAVDEEAPQETVSETVMESETLPVETELEIETEMETETGKDIEDILHDIQNTLSGNSVGETSGTADGDAVSGNSLQESVSGNDYVSVDYTEGLQGIQDSLDGLQATVTCIFIIICLYFVKQAAKHFIKGFMGGKNNG